MKDPADIQLVETERDRVAELRSAFYRDLRDRHIAYLGQSDGQIEAFSRAIANHLSEMGLIAAFRLFGSSRIPKTVSSELKGSVVNPLSKELGAPNVSDIDYIDAVAKAYCRLGEKARIDYLVKTLRGLDPAIDLVDAENAECALRNLESDFRTTLRQKSLPNGLIGDSAYQQAFVCERTQAWLKRFTKQQPGSTYFYAVGLAHVFPAPGANADCQGLLKDLQSAGFAISALD